eukprot:CAMPEP_0197518190 /NCGR_PEP_ID=MMETSP1318-20131121/3317_1 /TAXON_ID=552666 /ORGANISM="Partenskyella glossopodia, Strain RCC365" /LENGTH=374 /DNA_ID=CAMNT_0043068313 /DNA_START=1 /DNA_END=1125 /DNA_ORIENTATION=+
MQDGGSTSKKGGLSSEGGADEATRILTFVYRLGRDPSLHRKSDQNIREKLKKIDHQIKMDTTLGRENQRDHSGARGEDREESYESEGGTRGAEKIIKNKRNRRRKRKAKPRGTSPTHFPKHPDIERNYGPKFTLGLPARSVADETLRPIASIYIGNEREIYPNANNQAKKQQLLQQNKTTDNNNNNNNNNNDDDDDNNKKDQNGGDNNGDAAAPSPAEAAAAAAAAAASSKLAEQMHIYREYSSLEVLLSPLRRPLAIDKWCARDVALFEAGICAHGKDFEKVAKLIPGKNTAGVVKFYYSTWKLSKNYLKWATSGLSADQKEKREDELDEFRAAAQKAYKRDIVAATRGEWAKRTRSIDGGSFKPRKRRRRRR